MPKRAGANKRAANQALTSQEKTGSGLRQATSVPEKPTTMSSEEEILDSQLKGLRVISHCCGPITPTMRIRIPQSEYEYDPVGGLCLDELVGEFHEMLAIVNTHNNITRGLEEEVTRRLDEEQEKLAGASKRIKKVEETLDDARRGRRK